MLSRESLLQLSIISYAVNKTHFRHRLTVGDVAQEIKANVLADHPPRNPVKTSREEWLELLDFVLNDRKFSDYYLSNFYSKDGLLCFVAKDSRWFPSDVALVFRGTAVASDWDDNAITAYRADSPLQLAAMKYLRHLPSRYSRKITTTGHSKGGNYAQYLAIRSSRIIRAVSFDTSGFSPEFIEKYRKQIKRGFRKIVNISAASEVIHAMLIPIPHAKQIFIKTLPQRSQLHYHKPNILLDESGKLLPTTREDQSAAKAVAMFSGQSAKNLSVERRKKMAHAFADSTKSALIRSVTKKIVKTIRKPKTKEKR